MIGRSGTVTLALLMAAGALAQPAVPPGWERPGPELVPAPGGSWTGGPPVPLQTVPEGAPWSNTGVPAVRAPDTGWHEPRWRPERVETGPAPTEGDIRAPGANDPWLYRTAPAPAQLAPLPEALLPTAVPEPAARVAERPGLRLR